jgi:hypothetical protein
MEEQVTGAEDERSGTLGMLARAEVHDDCRT